MSVKMNKLVIAMSAGVLLVAAGCSQNQPSGVTSAVNAKPVAVVTEQVPPAGAQADVLHQAAMPQVKRMVAEAELFVSPAMAPAIMPYPPVSGENYQRFSDSGFIKPASQPLSTFSLDVDTASFANVRRFVNQGQLPPVDAVRTEELINYFAYDDFQPEDDQALTMGYELGVTPWNPETRLLRISVKSRAEQISGGANLVFLVDVSGSMSAENKLPLVKKSLRMLVKQLQPEDKISLITYAGAVNQVLSAAAGNEQAKILQAIDALDAGGGTYGEGGLRMAYQQAEQHLIKDGVNRVLLATDGDFNLGMSGIKELERFITQRRQAGISLSVLGYGDGNYNDNLMEVLSNAGNGNAAYIDSLQEARKVLSEQQSATFHTLAWDSKIQVEFNPATVASYRLIGYENRQLADEAFLDDSVDAGEVGANQSVTALYEVVLRQQPQIHDLRYQQPVETVETNTNELAYVRLRYKSEFQGSSAEQSLPVQLTKTCVPLSACSDDFRFVAAVAAYGQKLRINPVVAAYSWEDLIDLASQSKGTDEYGYRSGFIQQLRLTARL